LNGSLFTGASLVHQGGIGGVLACEFAAGVAQDLAKYSEGFRDTTVVVCHADEELRQNVVLVTGQRRSSRKMPKQYAPESLRRKRESFR